MPAERLALFCMYLTNRAAHDVSDCTNCIVDRCGGGVIQNNGNQVFGLPIYAQQFVSAIAVLALMIFSKNTIVLGIAERVANFDVEVLKDTFALSLSRLNLGFFILAVLCLTCVLAFVIYKVVKRTKNNNFIEADSTPEIDEPQHS